MAFACVEGLAFRDRELAAIPIASPANTISCFDWLWLAMKMTNRTSIQANWQVTICFNFSKQQDIYFWPIKSAHTALVVKISTLYMFKTVQNLPHEVQETKERKQRCGNINATLTSVQQVGEVC